MAKKRKGFAGFSPRELEVIVLRVNGVKPGAIAKRLCINRVTAYDLLWSAMRKVGVDDVCLLTRWAMRYGFDEPLGPESPEDAEIVRPKVYKGRIRLNRIGRRLTGASS